MILIWSFMQFLITQVVNFLPIILGNTAHLQILQINKFKLNRLFVNCLSVWLTSSLGFKDFDSSAISEQNKQAIGAIWNKLNIFVTVHLDWSCNISCKVNNIVMVVVMIVVMRLFVRISLTHLKMFRHISKEHLESWNRKWILTQAEQTISRMASRFMFKVKSPLVKMGKNEHPTETYIPLLSVPSLRCHKPSVTIDVNYIQTNTLTRPLWLFSLHF